jgi:ABC-2 type transport system permease protein
VHALRVYAALLRASLRAQLRYRLSVAFDGLGYFVIFWSEFAALWILFGHFGRLADWSVAEVMVCYGLAHLGYALSELVARGFDFLAPLTRTGAYDRLLLRPVSTTVQLLGHEFALHRFGRLVQSLAVLVWGLEKLGQPVTTGGVALLGLAAAGGCALFSGLYVLQGCVGMKTLQNLEAFNILTNGGPEVAQVPMAIYPRPFRLVYTFIVPLAGVTYYPVLTCLSRADGALWLAGWLGPAGGFAFLGLALLVFRLVEQSYVSTGS